MDFKKIAILGGGNLGSSIAKGLIKGNVLPPENISVTRRRVHLLDELKDQGVQVSDDNIAATKGADLIIIAVKPSQAISLLDLISPKLDPNNQIVVSVITGISNHVMQRALGQVPVFRAMPNTAIALCESLTCIAANPKHEELEWAVTKLFNKLGKTVVINEELMGAATVLGACGIAFALRFMRAVSQGGIEIGFGADISQLITAQTIKGATQLILESGNHPEKEIDKVTTPMGITISGLNEMEHQGFSPAVIKGLLTSFNKLEGLSNGD